MCSYPQEIAEIPFVCVCVCVRARARARSVLNLDFFNGQTLLSLFNAQTLL